MNCSAIAGILYSEYWTCILFTTISNDFAGIKSLETEQHEQVQKGGHISCPLCSVPLAGFWIDELTFELAELYSLS
jgi:hypothetical protein